MTEWSDEAVDAMMRKIGERPGGAGEHVDDALLIAYRDRRLDEPNIAAVEEHLAACADCRLLLESLHAPVPVSLEKWARGTLRRSPARRNIIAAALAVAAAAVLVFALFPSPNDRPLNYRARGPFGGVETMRGVVGESRRFVPSSRFELLFAPVSAATEPVSLWVFVRGRDGQLTPAPAAAIARGAGGTFRFELEAGKLFGESEFGSRSVIAALIRGSEASPAVASSEEELRRRFPVVGWFLFEVEYLGTVEGEGLR